MTYYSELNEMFFANVSLFMRPLVKSLLESTCLDDFPATPFMEAVLSPPAGSPLNGITASLGTRGFTWLTNLDLNGTETAVLANIDWIIRTESDIPPSMLKPGEGVDVYSPAHLLAHNNSLGPEVNRQHLHSFFGNMPRPEVFSKIVNRLSDPRYVKAVDAAIIRSEERVVYPRTYETIMTRVDIARVVREYKDFYRMNIGYYTERERTCENYLQTHLPLAMQQLGHIVSESQKMFMLSFICCLMQRTIQHCCGKRLKDKQVALLSIIVPIVLSSLVTVNELNTSVVSLIMIFLGQVVTSLPGDVKLFVDIMTYLIGLILMMLVFLPGLYETASVGTAAYFGMRTASICLEIVCPPSIPER
jgi:hypothetical protein